MGLLQSTGELFTRIANKLSGNDGSSSGSSTQMTAMTARDNDDALPKPKPLQDLIGNVGQGLTAGRDRADEPGPAASASVSVYKVPLDITRHQSSLVKHALQIGKLDLLQLALGKEAYGNYHTQLEQAYCQYYRTRIDFHRGRLRGLRAAIEELCDCISNDLSGDTERFELNKNKDIINFLEALKHVIFFCCDEPGTKSELIDILGPKAGEVDADKAKETFAENFPFPWYAAVTNSLNPGECGKDIRAKLTTLRNRCSFDTITDLIDALDKQINPSFATRTKEFTGLQVPTFTEAQRAQLKAGITDEHLAQLITAFTDAYKKQLSDGSQAPYRNPMDLGEHSPELSLSHYYHRSIELDLTPSHSLSQPLRILKLLLKLTQDTIGAFNADHLKFCQARRAHLVREREVESNWHSLVDSSAEEGSLVLNSAKGKIKGAQKRFLPNQSRLATLIKLNPFNKTLAEKIVRNAFELAQKYKEAARSPGPKFSSPANPCKVLQKHQSFEALLLTKSDATVESAEQDADTTNICGTIKSMNAVLKLLNEFHPLGPYTDQTSDRSAWSAEKIKCFRYLVMAFPSEMKELLVDRVASQFELYNGKYAGQTDMQAEVALVPYLPAQKKTPSPALARLLDCLLQDELGKAFFLNATWDKEPSPIEEDALRVVINYQHGQRGFFVRFGERIVPQVAYSATNEQQVRDIAALALYSNHRGRDELLMQYLLEQQNKLWFSWFCVSSHLNASLRNALANYLVGGDGLHMEGDVREAYKSGTKPEREFKPAPEKPPMVQLAQAEERVHEFAENEGALHRALASQAEKLEDKDKALVDKDKALVDKDKALVDKDKALVDKDKALEENAKALEDKDAQIAELMRQLALAKQASTDQAAASTSGQIPTAETTVDGGNLAVGGAATGSGTLPAFGLHQRDREAEFVEVPLHTAAVPAAPRAASPNPAGGNKG